jgi:peptidoglycan/xylan/chitin deacetylase (PgdA/CDA1 family)
MAGLLTQAFSPTRAVALELFARNNSKATFFILTTVAEAYPELIREIEREGHEIGVHGYQHRLVYRLTPAEFEKDLKKSLAILRGIGVRHIYGFRAPYWSITKESFWALDILKSNGLRYDSSIFPFTASYTAFLTRRPGLMKSYRV